ncbi:type II secretion system protein [Candidatus Parcubacteria bacterium]|nr:type II secretion system protein [Candidatus Parcubacteria bacterium]
MFKKLNQKGFTLIELLVVIAIIGILSTMAVVALTGANTKARDSKRMSDLKVLQTAVEMYISDNGGDVPAPTLGAVDAWDNNGAVDLESLLSEYLSSALLPEDPSGTARDWVYCFESTNDKYLLGVTLEREQTIKGDMDTTANWTAAECISSDDGLALGAVINCSDVAATGVLSDDTGTAFCIGSDDTD